MKKKKHKNKKHLKWGPNSPAQAVGSAIILNSGIDKVLLNIFLCRHRVQKEGDSQGREFLYFSPNSDGVCVNGPHWKWKLLRLQVEDLHDCDIQNPLEVRTRQSKTPTFVPRLFALFSKTSRIGTECCARICRASRWGGNVFQCELWTAHQAGCRAHEERHGRCRLFWDVYPVTTATNLATF